MEKKEILARKPENQNNGCKWKIFSLEAMFFFFWRMLKLYQKEETTLREKSFSINKYYSSE